MEDSIAKCSCNTKWSNFSTEPWSSQNLWAALFKNIRLIFQNQVPRSQIKGNIHIKMENQIFSTVIPREMLSCQSELRYKLAHHKYIEKWVANSFPWNLFCQSLQCDTLSSRFIARIPEMESKLPSCPPVLLCNGFRLSFLMNSNVLSNIGNIVILFCYSSYLETCPKTGRYKNTSMSDHNCNVLLERAPSIHQCLQEMFVLLPP